MNNSIEVNERVDVVATFSQTSAPYPCRPVRFRYHGRTIDISEIGLVHPTKYGHRMVHVFDVTDGSADYRIVFDAESLTWTLKYIADGSDY